MAVGWARPQRDNQGQRILVIDLARLPVNGQLIVPLPDVLVLAQQQEQARIEGDAQANTVAAAAEDEAAADDHPAARLLH